MKSIVLLVCLMLAGACALYCGSNCPSGGCVACPCGTSSNYIGEQTAESYMQEAGLNVALFTCIAQHESGFNAASMNQNGGTMVVGLFQEGDDNGYSAESLCNPATAAAAAAAFIPQCGICPWLDDGNAGCFNVGCCGGSYCNNQCGQEVVMANHTIPPHMLKWKIPKVDLTMK
eukprot:TRINITY_DN863_c0_g1_i1.p2 TRINITY_DN863_c0_g1~~TRINITY_DN863_c0_g1_i1.p2  ORF type:complete len:187 (-),score=48.99 TRINITY_DN863_c0_g1_i1:589-1110(-)